MVWKQPWGARLPTSSLWESKQHPLGKRVRGAVSKWRISLEEEGKGGSATKGGALPCLCDRRQIRAGLWAVPGKPGMRGNKGFIPHA